MARTPDPSSKSQMIRDYRSKNPAATAKEIEDALAKKGTSINRQLIYNVMSKGNAPKKRGRPAKAANGHTNGHSNGDSISVEFLLEAQKLVATVGSIDEAKRALDTLAKLS